MAFVDCSERGICHSAKVQRIKLGSARLPSFGLSYYPSHSSLQIVINVAKHSCINLFSCKFSIKDYSIQLQSWVCFLAPGL